MKKRRVVVNDMMQKNYIYLARGAGREKFSCRVQT